MAEIFPRYKRSGGTALPVRKPVFDFSGQDAAIKGYGSTAQALNQMSNYFAQMSSDYAAIEGAEYGAEHVPTAQQVADATPGFDDPTTPEDESLWNQAGGEIVPLGLPGSKHTTFGRAANKQWLALTSSQLQAKTVQDFATMALIADADPNMTPGVYAEQLNLKLHNMAKVLDETDAATALEFRALMGAKAAGLASTFNTNWLARERESLQSDHLASRPAVLRAAQAMMTSPVDPDTTHSAVLDATVTAWIRDNARFGATASANKGHQEDFYKAFDDYAWQALENWGLDRGVDDVAAFLKETDAAVVGPIDWLRRRGESDYDIRKQLRTILTESIDHRDKLEANEKQDQEAEFNDARLDWWKGFADGDGVRMAANLEAMENLPLMTAEYNEFFEKTKIDGVTLSDTLADHKKRIRAGDFDRQAIINDFGRGLSQQDVGVLLNELNTAENSNLQRALKLAARAVGADDATLIWDVQSGLPEERKLYNEIATELRIQFEDALAKGVEWNAVDAVKPLIEEKEAKHQKTIERREEATIRDAITRLNNYRDSNTELYSATDLEPALARLEQLNRTFDTLTTPRARNTFPDVQAVRHAISVMKKRIAEVEP